MKQVTIIVLLFLCFSCARGGPECEVHRILSERLLSLSTAESCTGGALTARFTALPGASVYFKSGIVAYNHEMKRNLLDVECSTIGLYGIVSEEVVCEMAEGARRLTGSDYAIATSGTAGPTGGTTENPIGTVWIAVATPDRTVSMRFFGGETRTEVIEKSSTAAIELLLAELQKSDSARSEAQSQNSNKQLISPR